MDKDVWALVHAERRALIADLERLEDAQWDQPSLCDGWTVHSVAAHLVDVARTTRLGFVVDMARARFDFDRQNANGIERARGATPQRTLESCARRPREPRHRPHRSTPASSRRSSTARTSVGRWASSGPTHGKPS
jgi:uncharacterized protein (TIGR03083 family)